MGLQIDKVADFARMVGFENKVAVVISPAIVQIIVESLLVCTPNFLTPFVGAQRGEHLFEIPATHWAPAKLFSKANWYSALKHLLALAKTLKFSH